LPYLLILLQLRSKFPYGILWAELISILAMRVWLTHLWSDIRTDGWDQLLIPVFQLLALFVWFVVIIQIENK
jgi:hypothetical protein